MIIHKKIVTLLLLTALVSSGIAAISFSKGSHKNLKVLPQDISPQKLDSIMESYSKALGVSCNFCHVPLKNFPDSLDFASDEEPMKENARKMMRMTIHLNKTYFHFDTTQRPEYLKVVTCITCHRGEAFPAE
jgi:hypothetical protein